VIPFSTADNPLIVILSSVHLAVNPFHRQPVEHSKSSTVLSSSHKLDVINMSRHQEWLDGTEAHLGHGWKHVGYDADAQVNTYRDLEGNLWESKPGNQYGPLKRVLQSKNPNNLSEHSKMTPAQQLRDGYERFKKLTKTDEIWDKRSDKTESKNKDQPPPPYTRRSRRFTSFDMLDRGMIANEDQIQPKEDGILAKLGRSLSIKRSDLNSGSPKRRSTISALSRGGRYRSGTI
jgi:hypothetical protein